MTDDPTAPTDPTDPTAPTDPGDRPVGDDQIAARPEPTPVELRASAALDEGAGLPPHDEAASLLAAMTEAVHRLRAAPAEVDTDERARRIAATLAAFDTLDLADPPDAADTDGVPAGGGAVVPITAAGTRRGQLRHRPRRRLTVAAGAAATVAVALGFGRLATGGAGDQVAGGGVVAQANVAAPPSPMRSAAPQRRRVP